MLRIYKHIIYILIVVLCSTQVIAQDIHFSQFYASPMLVNPSFSGLSDFKQLAGVHYRNQWSSVNSPFTTYSAFFDSKVKPKSFRDDWLGIGLNAYSDHSGNGGLLSNRLGLHAAYHKSLDKKHKSIVSLGANLSLVNKSLVLEKLTFQSQWNGTGYDNSLSSGENIANKSIFYPNLDVGALYSYSASNLFRLHLGGSLGHINRPKESFFTMSENKLNIKTTLQAGFHARIEEEIYVQLKALHVNQDQSNEIIYGGNLIILFNSLKAHAGVWFRSERDLIVVVGADANSFSVLISYDYNISPMKYYSGGNGGIELSIIKAIKSQSTSNKEVELVPYY